MKTFFVAACALLVLQHGYATPVQTRSADGVAALFSYLQNIPAVLMTTISTMGKVSANLNALTPDQKAVFTAFSALQTSAMTIGTELENDLNNPNATLGFKQFKSDVNQLYKALEAAINATMVVSPMSAASFQTMLNNIATEKSNIVVAVRTASAGGLILTSALDDPTLMAIQTCVQDCLSLVNMAVSVFASTLPANFV